MQQLCFYRRSIRNQVFVLGVKRPGEPIFYQFTGPDQSLEMHPLSVRNKLEKCKTTRTSAINLDGPAYEAYVRDGRFVFRGKELQLG